MKIDRQKFLVLVTGIASGCGSQPAERRVAPPVVVAPSQEPSPDRDASDGQIQPDSKPPSKALGPGAEGVLALTPTSDDGSCRASTNLAPRGGACSDAVGAPASCTSVRLDGGCSSFPFICDKCESYKQNFKPRVAEHAVACVVAQRKSQLSDGCETYRCGDDALLRACPDGSARPVCVAVAKSCNTTVEACTRMLSGMNKAGRNKVAACAQSGCSYGLWSCIEGM